MALGTAYGGSPVTILDQRPSDTDPGLVTRPILPRSAFGEVKVENTVPILQMTAVYGITDQQRLFTLLDGTAVAADGLFVSSSGTDPLSFGSVVSRKQGRYRAGQGLLAQFTALFDTPQIGNEQMAGLIANTDRMGFGFIGTDFGIIYNRGGATEIQELTLTAAAAGAEDATVTIDGTAFTVPLTAGTVQHNALEIADSLTAQVPGFEFSSNDDQVVAVAVQAMPFAGAFTLASATAAGVFVQITAGLEPTRTIIKQVDWNVDTRADLDPAKGNFYQVQFQYGFGAFFFSVENPETGELELVHILENSNTNLVPSLSNPTFRVGWLSRNTGSTISVTIKGGSAAMFNEGPIVLSESPRTFDHIQPTIGTTDFTNIITHRNRLAFNGRRNRVEISPLIVTAVTDSAKGAVIQISKEAALAGDLDFAYIDKNTSVSEIATDAVIATNGVSLVSFVTTTLGNRVDLAELGLTLFPGETFTISAKIIGGASAAVTVAVTMVEDQ